MSVTLDLNNLKEKFSYAHIHAVVAAAGYSYDPANRDEDMHGIDCKVRALGAIGSRRSPALDVQVKSTSQSLKEDNSYIYYDLEATAYQNLIYDDYLVPRILILVLLPKDQEDWLSSLSDKELCLRKCSYWKSLQGEPKSSNKSTVRIQIPKSNLFSVQSLKLIMDKLQNHQAL